MTIKKQLELKTPYRNVFLQLYLRENSVTKKDEVDAALHRRTSSGYLFKRLCFTWAKLEACSLKRSGKECLLWIDSTCFDLRSQDVELITATFGIRCDDDAITDAAKAADNQSGQVSP